MLWGEQKKPLLGITIMVTATATATEKEVHRFVPQGKGSLVDDAPGWEDSDGPTCWKCKGVGTTGMPKQKKRKKHGKNEAPSSSDEKNANATITADDDTKEEVSVTALRKICTVCQGRGHLLKRKVPQLPGRITRGRKREPQGWRPMGPAPAAMQKENLWSKMVQRANDVYVDVEIPEASIDGPVWLPCERGAELCNLVGTWRILQRVGSHRWTTDDLVTAWAASVAYQEQHQQQQVADLNKEVSYLDLGTGNGSVLQMVTWALLKDECHVKAIGVEARSEAVALARRSLAFNVDNDDVARILHGDFRDLRINDRQFDLVTGTPPYFRVDFDVRSDTIGTALVSKAVINQGGMPTAKQSAPARCEFRGGIEAYCEAAERVLKPVTGRFVVCENWLNHDRVMAAAKACKLDILKQVEVMGKEEKANLFAVYVMKKKCSSDAVGTKPSTVVKLLTVRTATGNWTDEYKELVLSSMSIPSS
jgi:tRNA1(Val) A37 N6-methylase TrmN6